MPLDASELDLIKRTLSGDQHAFGSLILVYERPLLAYVYSILHDWEWSRDVVQETFTAAYYALPNWKHPEQQLKEKKTKISQKSSSNDKQSYVRVHPLFPWLYRIATNKALHFIKKQKYQEFIQTQMPPASNITPEEHYLTRELLLETLGNLSEEDAMCIVLRFGFDEKYDEIADRMNLTSESVRKRISRSLATLRSLSSKSKEELSR